MKSLPSRISNEPTMKLNSTTVGLSGEFYVLAQLNSRGLIATLTLGHTKGVDVLVKNSKTNKLFQVEVKTTTSKKFSWILNKSAETRKNKDLIYIFVHLTDLDTMPGFFIVPSIDVANYTYNSHRFWLSGGNRKDTTMRKFDIDPNDPNNYRNNWELFN
jgi:hypothetical protein